MHLVRLYYTGIELHAIHTACGIETLGEMGFSYQTVCIACNPYRLRY